MTARLVTFVDVDRYGDRQISLSARLDAILDDGQQVVLLDDRGWSASGPADLWARTSIDDIMDTARTVVGPDGPFEGRSRTDMEADHWAHLAEILQQHGVAADAARLRRLPHDVVLSARLLARIGRAQGDAIQR